MRHGFLVLLAVASGYQVGWDSCRPVVEPPAARQALPRSASDCTPLTAAGASLA
jgi:hypothetical protein